ncbi:MAG: imidazole glycerol phosphate synthase subunit HisH [Thermomicrobiales bacterium]
MIAIIDYDAGNLRSIQRALLETGADVTITADPAEVVAADRVVFPGDGHAKTAMETLSARGLTEAIHTSVNAGKPFLGVCVGMQLLFEEMEEGPTTGLGLLKGTVRKLPDVVKVPQIGWNTVSFRDDSPLAHLDGAYFYFVHSFAPQAEREDDIAGETDYGVRFTSVVMHDNVWGTQFHPEKSGEDGLDLIRTWATWGREGRGERSEK